MIDDVFEVSGLLRWVGKYGVGRGEYDVSTPWNPRPPHQAIIHDKYNFIPNSSPITHQTFFHPCWTRDMWGRSSLNLSQWHFYHHLCLFGSASNRRLRIRGGKDPTPDIREPSGDLQPSILLHVPRHEESPPHDRRPPYGHRARRGRDPRHPP